VSVSLRMGWWIGLMATFWISPSLLLVSALRLQRPEKQQEQSIDIVVTSGRGLGEDADSDHAGWRRNAR
jgi:hypothetical protein